MNADEPVVYCADRWFGVTEYRDFRRRMDQDPVKLAALADALYDVGYLVADAPYFICTIGDYSPTDEEIAEIDFADPNWWHPVFEAARAHPSVAEGLARDSRLRFPDDWSDEIDIEWSLSARRPLPTAAHPLPEGWPSIPSEDEIDELAARHGCVDTT